MSNILSIWVKARYTGQRAKSVLEHANAGIGYIVLERPETGSGWVVAAFRRISGPLPPGVEQIKDPRMLDALDKKMMPMNSREKASP